LIELQPFTPVDVAMRQIVETYDLDVVISGGSGFGWSYYSTYQRCPRAFELQYCGEPVVHVDERAPLAIGSLIHAFLAFYYNQVKSDGWYKATEEASSFVHWFKARLYDQGINPLYLEESWRVFSGYREHWIDSDITAGLEVIATESTVRNEKERFSCRYDAIIRLHNDTMYAPPGLYIMEHKSAARFTTDLLEGWHLDGEIMGQAMLWPKKQGKLAGVIVNMIGKQQHQQFQRILARVTPEKVEAHKTALKHTRTAIAKATKKEFFPQYLAGCVTRWGRCDHFDKCNS